jgi:hypothetical protein
MSSKNMGAAAWTGSKATKELVRSTGVAADAGAGERPNNTVIPRKTDAALTPEGAFLLPDRWERMRDCSGKASRLPG